LVTRENEDHGNAVGVLPYDPVRRTANVVKQFRTPIFHAAGVIQTLEVIAGGLAGADPTSCERCAALEEAGLRLGAVNHALKGMNMRGVSTMCIDLYLATYRKEYVVGEGAVFPMSRRTSLSSE
jgi:hypothetical protein